MKQFKNILVLVYAFPPIPYSGTYRILRLCRNLPKLGFKVNVMTIPIDKAIPNDYRLLNHVPDDVAVFRTKIFDPWLRYQQWKSDHVDSSGYKYINKIVSLFFRLIFIPDHQIFWIPTAVLKAKKIIDQHQIKTLFVSSPPTSTLLTGVILKKMTKIRFVADLRDPIVGNIAQTNLINPKDIISRFEKKVLMWIERLVVKNADLVITNTESHRKEMTRNYNSEKFPTVRNSFEESDYHGINREKYDQFTISHTGAMYGNRNANILFDAIKSLEQKVLPTKLNLQVVFVGSVDDSVMKAIKKYGVEKYVLIKGRVSHKEAIEIMVKSHLLLLVKATGEGSLGQIPAKFFEYLGAQSKIFFIGPKMSEVASIMKELENDYVFENDKNELCRALQHEYDLYLNGLNKDCELPNIREFSSLRMSEKIATYL